MEKNYLEEVTKLIDENIKEKSTEERLKLVNEETKKEKPNLDYIQKLLKKGVGKNMTMNDVLRLIKKKNFTEGVNKRIEEIKAETEKLAPNIKKIQTLLDEGVDGKMTIESVMKIIEENKTTKIPLYFKEFVSKLAPDEFGKIKDYELQIIKEHLKNKSVTLDVNTLTKKGITLLHVAVGMGDVELAELLIEREAILDSNGNGSWKPPTQWGTDIKEQADKVRKIIKEAKRRV